MRCAHSSLLFVDTLSIFLSFDQMADREGSTALHAAARHNLLSICKALVQAGEFHDQKNGCLFKMQAGADVDLRHYEWDTTPLLSSVAVDTENVRMHA